MLNFLACSLTSMAASRRAVALTGCASRSVLLVCDIQERFRPLIYNFSSLVVSSRTLLEGCALLGVPAVCTEQNPAKLGSTVAELAPLLSRAALPKTRFSMCSDEVLALFPPGTEHALICGIEAHVCVAQTCHDLLARGIHVHVVVDAVSSQAPGDRAVALAGLQAAGAALTTTEAALFALLGDAQHAAFKGVQKVAIAHAKLLKDVPHEQRLDRLA